MSASVHGLTPVLPFLALLVYLRDIGRVHECLEAPTDVPCLSGSHLTMAATCVCLTAAASAHSALRSRRSSARGSFRRRVFALRSRMKRCVQRGGGRPGKRSKHGLRTPDRGMVGVLVTCERGREDACWREVQRLLDDVLDEHWSRQQEPETSENADVSVSDALDRELAELKEEPSSLRYATECRQSIC